MQKEINIPLTAQPIDDHYELDMSKQYPVEDLTVSQSSSYLTIKGIDKKVFNTIHFRFYVWNKEVDIFKSPLLNPYIMMKKGIYYKEG